MTTRHSHKPAVPRAKKSIAAGEYDSQRIAAAIKPIRLHFFPSLKSTNDHAAVLRKRRELFAPALVLANRQTAGRGRGSNTWWSGPGSITATFVFRADMHLAAHHVPLIAGLAVRDAVAELIGYQQVQLKWPNDLVYCDRKLAGLLCERLGAIDLIGVGINVNLPREKGRPVPQGPPPKSLRSSAVWMGQIAAWEFDLNQVVIAVAQSLHRALGRRAETPFAQVLARYDRHHALVGRRISVSDMDGTPPLLGVCEGLDSVGRLLLRPGKGAAETGLQRLITGTVRLLR
jgi:BirA family biotin operon repressor/biotin-[acetyl-CoA-carboxylase] ligase